MHEWLELDILSLQNSTNCFDDQQVHEVHASLVAQIVKCLPATLETWVRSPGWEDPQRRKWQPTPVLLPGKFHGQSLVGNSPWGCKESDTTERLYLLTHLIKYMKRCSTSLVIVVAIQSQSCVRLFVTPCTAACQASLNFSISWNLSKFTSIELVVPSNHLILCLSLLFLPSIFLSIRVFSSESTVCIRRPKYWSFSFGISLPNEYSGLISFRIDWFDFFRVQGTLKSLLQHQNLEASILWRSVFLHYLIGANQHPDSSTTENSRVTAIESPNQEKVPHSPSIPLVRLLNWSFGGSHLIVPVHKLISSSVCEQIAALLSH